MSPRGREMFLRDGEMSPRDGEMFLRDREMFPRDREMFLRNREMFPRDADGKTRNRGGSPIILFKEGCMSGDWLPKKREEIMAMARTWTSVLPERSEAWEITTGELNRLNSARNAALASMNDAEANKGDRHLNAVAKQSLDTLINFMRVMHRRRFTMPPLETADFVLLGMPAPDRTRTAHTVVNEHVEFGARPVANGQIALDFRQAGAAHKAKPTGYDGAVIVWSVIETGQELPTNPADLKDHVMASRTPHILTFKESDRGKSVVISMAWQNERGITGAWAPIKRTIVP